MNRSTIPQSRVNTFHLEHYHSPFFVCFVQSPKFSRGWITTLNYCAFWYEFHYGRYKIRKFSELSFHIITCSIHIDLVLHFFGTQIRILLDSRQKSRAGVQGAPALSSAVQVKGPDEEKIKQILARTGYTLDVTTGQWPRSTNFMIAYQILNKLTWGHHPTVDEKPGLFVPTT